jgi:hypothetical protein
MVSHESRAARRRGRCPAAAEPCRCTPFMGVRISWLMLARNSLLARAATSARDALLGVDTEDGRRYRSQQQFGLFLGAAQCVLHLLLLGDVFAHTAVAHHATVAVANRDSVGELADPVSVPVLMPGDQVLDGASLHEDRAQDLHDAGLFFILQVVERARAHDLVDAVADELLDASADVGVDGVCVGLPHPVRRRPDHVAQPLFTLLALLHLVEELGVGALEILGPLIHLLLQRDGALEERVGVSGRVHAPLDPVHQGLDHPFLGGQRRLEFGDTRRGFVAPGHPAPPSTSPVKVWLT